MHGDGYPLVLAHAFTASKEMWADQIGPFSEKYQVVVYDARGHGESEAPPADDAGYALDTFVEDQRALMEHLGIEQAYVCGISMGGMIAVRFALEHPQTVRALLLCDTTAEVAAAISQWHGNWHVIEGLVRSLGVASVLRNFYAQRALAMGIRRLDQVPAGARRFLERHEQMSADGFLGSARAIGEQESVLERLSEITAPTLILTGDQDYMRGPSEQMKERMPDARFVLINGSFHGTCLWQPEAFTDAVLDFLSAVDAGRPVAGREEQ